MTDEEDKNVCSLPPIEVRCRNSVLARCWLPLVFVALSCNIDCYPTYNSCTRKSSAKSQMFKPSSTERDAFFFEQLRENKSRTRFNLLLLEFGEFFFEDRGVHLIPLPNDSAPDRSLELADAIKVQGRIKLCSRSFIFEPADIKKPLMKFPFKSIVSPIQYFDRSNYPPTLIDTSCWFTFLCCNYFEMKADNKIGPYKFVEFSKGREHRIMFSLTHSDIDTFVNKVNELYRIYNAGETKGFLGASASLSSLAQGSSAVSVFDNSLLVDFHEKLLLQYPVSVKKVSPLVLNPGGIMITSSRIYFQPAELNNVGDKVLHFEVKNIKKMYAKRYLLLDTALEFILNNGKSFLFVFDDRSTRDKIHDSLSLEKSKSFAEIRCMWQKREISNAEYLMYVNNEAGRSLNDLTQYPVFPHVIADYTSKSLKLDKPSSFRDLTKPVGALDQKRLEYFLERYNNMPPGDPSNGIPPPFMYGTHYSTPGYVLYYLVRVAPEHLLNLQNGKFDAPDRMFFSIAENWKSCMSNPADLKELIPEFFFGSGEFLVNSDDLDLGMRQTGERLNDVELPPWAKSHKDFIRKNAKALESEYVSENLHHWIDLIFGYKQLGEEAKKACNVFYYLTYAGAVNLDEMTNDHERAAIEAQIQEFGQTPRQIFKAPHPSRNAEAVLNDLSEKNIVDSTEEKIDQDESCSDKKADDTRDNKVQNTFARHDAEPAPTLSSSSSSSSSSSQGESSILSTALASVTGDSGNSNPDSSGGKKALSIFETFSSRTVSFLDRAFGGSLSSSGSPAKAAAGDIKESTTEVVKSSGTEYIGKSARLKIRPVFPPTTLFESGGISGIDYDIISGSLAICSRHGQFHLVELHVDDILKAVSSSAPKEYNVLRNIRCGASSNNNQAFSSCCVGPQGSFIILSCWDNNLYSYSCKSSSTAIMSSIMAHEDAISSIDVWHSHVTSSVRGSSISGAASGASWIASGSWDSSVKLWSCESGMINQKVSYEFFGNTSSVHVVALAQHKFTSQSYIASGSEDGVVIVWNVTDQKILFKCQASAEKMAVSSMKWIHGIKNSHTQNQNMFCIVGTVDGVLMALDLNGDVMAVKYLGDGNVVRSLEVSHTKSVVICALEDMSIRAYIFDPLNGKFLELFVAQNAHGNKYAVSTLHLLNLVNLDAMVLFSGSEGGDLKTWIIEKS